jgi:hypothetical protein
MGSSNGTDDGVGAGIWFQGDFRLREILWGKILGNLFVLE